MMARQGRGSQWWIINSNPTFVLKGRSINFLDIIILKHGNGRHDGMNVLRRILMVFEDTTNKCSRGVPPSALAIPLVGLSQESGRTHHHWMVFLVEFKLFNGCDTCPEIMRISTIIHLGSEQQRPTQHIRRRPPSRCSCWPFAGVDRQRPQTQTNERCQPTDRPTIRPFY